MTITVTNVMSAINGTQIRIIRPPETKRDYYNRKRYDRISMQAIVTSDEKFTDDYVGEPGSMHDARVLQRSSIHEIAQTNPEFFGQFRILGDSA